MTGIKSARACGDVCMSVIHILIIVWVTVVGEVRNGMRKETNLHNVYACGNIHHYRSLKCN